MDILSAIKREERKLEKQIASIQHKLRGIKAAAEAMGRAADKKVTKSTKRVLSAAARAKIGKARLQPPYQASVRGQRFHWTREIARPSDF